MKLVYTHENNILVSNVQNLLEDAGIEIELRNQYAGGAKGELPVFMTWPEVWVVNEKDLSRARQLIELLDNPPQGDTWKCEWCEELNEPGFDFCWRCQNPKPAAD